jgi:hypothetical protein
MDRFVEVRSPASHSPTGSAGNELVGQSDFFPLGAFWGLVFVDR